jgi:hypothetical protein
MCRRVECSKCGRPTYAGCGMHIEQVLGNVPPAERCRCQSKEKEEEEKPTLPSGTAGSGLGSLIRSLLGK